jgi:nucleotide-binding universal stress UspA family protein
VSDGPVVVGVDGSPESDAAIGLAYAEAARRSTALVAVHAWVPAQPPQFGGEIWGDFLDAARQAGAELVERSLRPWVARFPHVRVEQRLSDLAPAAALVQAAENACLLVVGARGAGGLRGLLLGSATNAVLQHARVPVLVVPDGERADDAAAAADPTR